MKLGSLVRIVVTAFVVAAAINAYRNRQPAGRFLNVPYDFRFPTIERIKQRWWNPEDPRLLTPRVFGVGWSINLYQVRERLSGGLSTDGGAEV